MNKHYPCLDHVNWVVKLYLIFKKPKSVQIYPPLAKANRLLKISHVITIKDIDTDKTKEYNSIRAAFFFLLFRNYSAALCEREEKKKIKRITCKSFNITKLYGQR